MGADWLGGESLRFGFGRLMAGIGMSNFGIGTSMNGILMSSGPPGAVRAGRMPAS